MVFGRALALLTYHLLAALIAVVTTITVALTRGDRIPAELMGIALAAGFAFIGLALTVQLPVLFRIGYSRGRLIAYAPALIVAGLLWLNQAVGGIEIEGGLSTPVLLVIAAGAGIGVIGFVAGVLGAQRTFTTREIR